MPVPSTDPANFGIGSWIERRAAIAPNAVAIISGDRSITYRELAGRVRRLANGLRRSGVSRGDRVAWVGPNHVAFLEMLFASGLLGAALAPVNHRLDLDVIRAILEDTDPSVVVQHASVGAIAVPASVRHRISVDGPVDGATDLEALIGESSDDPIQTALDLDDVCLLPHTSGTTGRPKGIMLTHANVTWNVVNFLTCTEFRTADVTIAIAPFFRVGGTGVNVLPVLFMGGTVVVPTDPGADETLRLIERHRVSVGFGNPDSLDALTRSESWTYADLTSVRFFVTGGAPVPDRLIRTYLDRGVTLLQGYGLSEAAPLVLLVDGERALEKIGSAGRPPLFVDVRIVRVDGADAASGETGELLVRGPNVMAGYWNRPDATRRVLSSDGWLRTGDAARRDDEGDIWIVDRVADGYVSNGRLVYPGEVERALLAHPSVADVGVVDVPDGDGASVGVAFVVPSPAARATEQEILAFAGRSLTPEQMPQAVRFVDHLPRTSVGKLLRDRLRSLASSRISPGG